MTRQLNTVQRAVGAALQEYGTLLEETQVYVGLNDSETREQTFDTESYVATLKGLCAKHGTPFSFDVIEGGYIHDDGEYIEEKSIALTFIDVPRETVDQIAQELCTLFHQESVLVLTDRVCVRSVRETPHEP